MANWKSDQRTNEDAVPQVWAKPNEKGKVRRRFFSFTTPAGTVAINDTIELCKVRKGERILGGVIIGEAMSSGAGTATISLGDGTTAGKYLGATSVDAIFNVAFANTIALFFGEEVAADFTLTGTCTVEAFAAAKKLYGYIETLVDG